MDESSQPRKAAMTAQQLREDAVLDQWLRVSLKQRYAATLREPLPDALLDLLQPEKKS
jgi:hypothetical protein